MDIVFVNSSSNTLSTRFSKNFLLFIIFILGIHTPLVLAAQVFGLTFKTFSIISLILIIATVVCFILLPRPAIKKTDYGVLIALIVFGILGSVLGLVTNRPDSDDYFYTANAVFYLDQPDEPMNFEIHAFRGLTEDPVVSVGQGASTPYDYFRAVIAYFSGLNYLDIYYFLSLALIGFMVPVANFWMMSKFTEDTRLALYGAIMIFCVLLILTETHHTFGNFAFPRIYQGKAVALTIGIPIYIALSVSYFSEPSITRWLALSMTIMAVIGMSTSTTILFSILAVVLAVAFLAYAFPHHIRTKTMLPLIKKILLYMTNLFSAVLFALFLLIQQRRTGIDSFQIGGLDAFLPHFNRLVNPDFPLTIILVVLSLILLLVSKVDHKWFFIFWVLALIVFAANPMISNVLIDTVIPRNIYWRVFYLGPFPLLTGVIFIHIVQNFNIIQRRVIPITGMLMLLSLGYYFYNFSTLDQLHFPPGYKLPVEELAFAQRITEVAPEGVMLAPPEAYGIVPMLDSRYPQVRTRKDGNRLWLEKEERKVREKASLFVAGNDEYRTAFFKLIDQGFTDVIVFKVTPDEKVITLLIEKYGYQQLVIEGCCTIYSH